MPNEKAIQDARDAVIEAAQLYYKSESRRLRGSEGYNKGWIDSWGRLCDALEALKALERGGEREGG